MPENPFVHNVGQFPPSPRPRLVGNRRANQGGVRNYQDQDFDFDQDEDQFSVRRSEPGVQFEDMKYRLLEERLKVVEGKGVLGMDANDLGLVTGVKVPPKFKPPVTHATERHVLLLMQLLISETCRCIQRIRGF